MRLGAVLRPKTKHDDLAFSVADFNQSRLVMQNMISDETTAHERVAVGIAGDDSYVR